MILWTEQFVLTDSTVKNLKKKYRNPYFLKGDPDWGQHYTGYHRNPNNTANTVDGNFVDKELLQIYIPKLKEVLQKIGLYNSESIFSYDSIWGQLYTRELSAVIDVHNHYKHPSQLVSWVHFVDVPKQKCFYFMLGDQKVYPETQRTNDIIFYPSYAPHGVDKMEEGNDRFVVAGNIVQLSKRFERKFIDPKILKNS
tara:strand:+ start:1216 stop:1806 length:591 start_codon:yes stop_codon:yes gene_type:complete